MTDRSHQPTDRRGAMYRVHDPGGMGPPPRLQRTANNGDEPRDQEQLRRQSRDSAIAAADADYRENGNEQLTAQAKKLLEKLIVAVELHRNLKAERRDLDQAETALELAHHSAAEVARVRGKVSLLQEGICAQLESIAAHVVETKSAIGKYTDVLSTKCVDLLTSLHTHQEATGAAVAAARSFSPELDLRIGEWEDAARCQATYIAGRQDLSQPRYEALNDGVLMAHITADVAREKQVRLRMRADGLAEREKEMCGQVLEVAERDLVGAGVLARDAVHGHAAPQKRSQGRGMGLL